MATTIAGMQLIWGVPDTEKNAALSAAGATGEGIVTSVTRSQEGKTDEVINEVGDIAARVDSGLKYTYEAEVLTTAAATLPDKGTAVTISGLDGITVCDGATEKFTAGDKKVITVKFTNYPDMS